LNNIGLGGLHIQPETEESYALACQFAAEDAADDLPFVFEPVSCGVDGLGPVRLSSEVVAFDSSIAKGCRSFITTMNQEVREEKAWKRGHSVVCMGFESSYVPQGRPAHESSIHYQ
ncbi:MAG: hypothetical protein LC790_04615, partial [Actinobacteria bacterium]|nr:hypothetical protein [Actinomycetota bacterium]